MGRHKDHLTFAVNTAKYWCKRAKTDTERRWWFTRYMVLAGLVKIQLDDTNILKKGNQPADDLDVRVKQMMEQLGGADVGTEGSISDGNG